MLPFLPLGCINKITPYRQKVNSKSQDLRYYLTMYQFWRKLANLPPKMLERGVFIMFSDVIRKQNQCQIQEFGCDDDKMYKFVWLFSQKTKGLDCSSARVSGKKVYVNTEKLDNNISRAKSKIFELAYCNRFQYFVTLTIDPEKFDRSNLKLFWQSFKEWLKRYGEKYHFKVDYVFVPELHKDGNSWHLHGFIMGLPYSKLQMFKIGDKMGKAIADKVRAGDIVYNWLDYQENFGFCSIEPIRSRRACARYITKYINKALYENKDRFNCNSYYVSQDLKRKKIVKRGLFIGDDKPVKWSYENEYCKVLWLDGSPENLAFLQSLIGKVDYIKTRSRSLVPRIAVRSKKRLRILSRASFDAFSSGFEKVDDDKSLHEVLYG